MLTLPLDFADEESILNCVRSTASRFGRLWGVVNATYGSTGKRFDDLTANGADRANRLNLTGSFILAREAARHMSSGGSMVLYSSMYGLVAPRPDVTHRPWHPTPLNTGPARPGSCRWFATWPAISVRATFESTPWHRSFPHPATQEGSGEFMDNLARSTMLARIGRRDELAGPTAFLLESDASSYVTGQCPGVDGGWTAW